MLEEVPSLPWVAHRVLTAFLWAIRGVGGGWVPGRAYGMWRGVWGTHRVPGEVPVGWLGWTWGACGVL